MASSGNDRHADTPTLIPPSTPTMAAIETEISILVSSKMASPSAQYSAHAPKNTASQKLIYRSDPWSNFRPTKHTKAFPICKSQHPVQTKFAEVIAFPSLAETTGVPKYLANDLSKSQDLQPHFTYKVSLPKLLTMEGQTFMPRGDHL